MNTDLYTRAEEPGLDFSDSIEFLALVALVKEIEEDAANELDFNQEN